MEALTEFSVESAGFKAETGHASGGTVSFVSKSGTNNFHGNFYEFLRNQDLDARGFFAATKAVYKQNDFGATIGGPVWIPKIYNGRNRSFFFFSYEGFRNRVGANATPYSVPPPEFFTGDLRNWVDRNGKPIPIYDPATTTLVNGTYTRTPFPNNQIPQSQFDPVAKAIMNYAQTYVKPNLPGLVPGTSAYVRNNAVSFGTGQQPNNKYSIKGGPGDHVEAEGGVPVQPHAAGGFGLRQLDLHPAVSALGQSRVQPLGRVSPQLRLHPFADLAQPLLRGRQQLAAESRGVHNLFAERRRPTGFPPSRRGGKRRAFAYPTGRTATSIFPSRIFPTFRPGVGAPRMVRTISSSSSATT